MWLLVFLFFIFLLLRSYYCIHIHVFFCTTSLAHFWILFRLAELHLTFDGTDCALKYIAIIIFVYKFGCQTMGISCGTYIP